MATRAKRHIHKYYRMPYGNGEVWACGLPDCTHFLPTHMQHFVNGKYSICWSCDEKFTLHPANMTQEKPECDNCRLGIPKPEEPLSTKMKDFILHGGSETKQ